VSDHAATRGPESLLWWAGSDRGLGEDARGRRSGWRPENMRKRGFAPATVIDVGAAYGTPALYAAFPEAYHVMIDPLADYEPALRERLGEVRGEYLIAAVGDSEGTQTMRVDPSAPWTSSFMRSRATADVVPAERSERGRLGDAGPNAEERRIEVTTLDRLAAEGGWTAPFGLKVDTEGYEDRVILGAASVLEQTQFVIAEVSVAPRYDGGYSFADFVALMQSRGFALCDLIDASKPDPAGCLSYVDACFRRRSRD
jgi:FkbM family methyltransferase